MTSLHVASPELATCTVQEAGDDPMLPLHLIDTHTHFDSDDFDTDRDLLALQARQQGVDALILIGYVARYFDRLCRVQDHLHQLVPQPLHPVDPATDPHFTPLIQGPVTLLAPGLHPFYIREHQEDDLHLLERLLQTRHCVAVGEIGLDTYTPEMKIPAVYARQQDFFAQQLELAKLYQKPVLLHIRRAHADSLAILKRHRFAYGGIAHAFGGGIEEAKSFIKLGFKLGINGLVTDPNAKRLRQVVQAVGAEHLVLETDCPDMTPICCRNPAEAHTRNTPVNLPVVLETLSQLLNVDKQLLAVQLWHNTRLCLGLDWSYGQARWD